MELMGKIKEALLLWMKAMPQSGENCCVGGHFYLSGFTWEPKPDEKICEREYRWRQYVRLRDENPSWPFFH
jgi:hypothetical protein